MHQNCAEKTMGHILLSVAGCFIVTLNVEKKYKLGCRGGGHICKCILFSAAAAGRRERSSGSNCTVLFVSAEIIHFCFFFILLAKGVSL